MGSGGRLEALRRARTPGGGGGSGVAAARVVHKLANEPLHRLQEVNIGDRLGFQASQDLDPLARAHDGEHGDPVVHRLDGLELRRKVGVLAPVRANECGWYTLPSLIVGSRNLASSTAAPALLLWEPSSSSESLDSSGTKSSSSESSEPSFSTSRKSDKENCISASLAMRSRTEHRDIVSTTCGSSSGSYPSQSILTCTMHPLSMAVGRRPRLSLVATTSVSHTPPLPNPFRSRATSWTIQPALRSAAPRTPIQDIDVTCAQRGCTSSFASIPLQFQAVRVVYYS